jgi:hypothetical protein
VTSQAHPGPDFLGIGAQKSGTTWLHRMLAAHPDIGLPEGKELHFWDKRWPSEDPDRYDAVFERIPNRLRGEITPAYAALPPDTIAFIHSRYPSLRVLYVLRDPVARAWSHARSSFARRFPHVSGERLQEHREWFVAHFHSSKSLARGDYAACLHNWGVHYPRERLGVHIYEDALTDARAFLACSYAHLGADPGVAQRIPVDALESRVYPEVVLRESARSPLPEAVPAFLLPELLGIYAEKIPALSRLLDRDLAALWLAPHL